jgi:AcrR family transcriptional regulator
MPRNRQHIPRDERASDLLAAATRVFVANGYAATTMTDISEAAGVARANIYWYFPSKDDVFAAVMNELYGAEIADLESRNADLDAYTRLVIGLKQLYPYRFLHLEMHPRIEHSGAIHDAHETFMSWIRGLVYEVVDQAGAGIDKQMLADVIVATFEGARAPSETRPANELIPFILDTVLGGTRWSDAVESQVSSR